ncbi:amino acid adenylation domain-containing protein [Candidatus Leptofilum sp.]|uniref:amino acid adenylation domain-containing protein n=1 Tax=Candidatus Leptofilum sp. TaxID=3241576 RepID=UPI003B5AF538
MLNSPNFTPSPRVPTGLQRRIQLKEPLVEKTPKIERPNRFKFNHDALSNLSLLDQVLFEQFGQGPQVQVPFATMHRAFEHFAAIQPEAIAVAHQGESITYGELDRQANRLAAHLAELGVQTGDHVALFLQRSIPMIVGILATLKAGAAYVPQHVGVAPEAHLNYVLDVANIDVILTISRLADQVPVPDGRSLLIVDEFMQQPFADETEFVESFVPETAVSPHNTCFIIFTSGTTGTPNGVQVTHGNVGNILLTAPGNLGIQPGMKVGQILSIAFDMAAWEILGCLGNGGTLIIRGKDFMNVLRQVDVVISTPSILSSFDADQLHNVKAVAVAGEPCPRPLADKWSSFCTFYNSCGPTEVTIVNTAEQHFPWKAGLTIGKPTPNNTVYVLDENLRSLPIGEVGEMWAGGDCVSKGYIGNEVLTAERYRPDPFLGNGRMMFRTRDLGKWTAEGELEHYGRTDDQVKIRGFRVELDSVSAALESTPNCKRAVALKLDSRDLVGFVSPRTVDVETAKQAVADQLPYYCTPKFIIDLDELPKTPRGKINKRLLLEMAKAHDAALESER